MPPSTAPKVTSTFVSTSSDGLGDQVKASRSGGDQAVIRPHSCSRPSCQRSKTRPSRPASHTTVATSSSPTEWPATGHHREIPAVKSSKARAWSQGTVTVATTGSIVVTGTRTSSST